MPIRKHPDLVFIPGKNRVRLATNLAYWDERTQQLFIVSMGFESDCGSTPPFVWPVLGHPFDKDCREQFVLHDFLYRYNIVSRKVADQILFDSLIENGVSEEKAQAIHIGVRIGGAEIYAKYKKQLKENFDYYQDGNFQLA